MPPEILRLPTTDLILDGTVAADSVTPVTEKARARAPCRHACSRQRTRGAHAPGRAPRPAPPPHAAAARRPARGCAQVDCWSLGVAAHELLTGRSPFQGATKELLRAAILKHDMPPLPAFLSRGARAWLRAALEPDARGRPGALALLRHPWVAAHVGAVEAARLAALNVDTPAMLPALSGYSASADAPAEAARAGGGGGAAEELAGGPAAAPRGGVAAGAGPGGGAHNSSSSSGTAASAGAASSGAASSSAPGGGAGAAGSWASIPGSPLTPTLVSDQHQQQPQQPQQPQQRSPNGSKGGGRKWLACLAAHADAA